MLKIITLFFLLKILNCKGDIKDVLKSYETLHTNDFVFKDTSRSQRDVYSKSSLRRINVKLFGKNFELAVKPENSVLAKEFKAFTKSKKEINKKDIVTAKFFKGYVMGLEESSVRIHYVENDIFAAIDLPKEHIVIEPSWKFLPLSSNYSLIAYRTSELSSIERFKCGFVNSNISDEYKRDESKHREKRNTVEKNVCKLLLVADYKYFIEVGRKSFSETVNNMVSTITEVNAIYRATDFGNGFKNIGFEIETVLVNEEATKSSEKNHYNVDKSNWTPKDLLKAFGSDSSLKHERYCAAHLFTATKFSDGVQGLAWIAKAGSVGGICASGSGSTKYNTGWSTAIDKNGKRILTFESMLVAAHELGHNFGSIHDPSSCIGDVGGTYLMYAYSVTGKNSNNMKFSRCSKSYISKVLQNRASSCFKKPSNSYCGNFKREGDEECDVGNVDSDKCCTKDCKFKPNALCSDKNSPCCTNCALANSTVKCLDQSNMLNCKLNSFCSGKSSECPEAKFKKNGSPCVDNGKCKDGVCESFCESFNKNTVSCLCQNEDSCSICCRFNNKTCEVYKENGKKYILSDGRPCFEGYCEKGACKKTKQSINKLWNVITTLNLNDIVEFFKKNVVMMVIIFFSLIYIPITIIISCVDYKNKKKENNHKRWKTEMPNDMFLSDCDKLNIKTTRKKSRKNYIRDDKNLSARKESRRIKLNVHNNKVAPSNT